MRCQSNAWNDSVCGVTALGFTVGTTMHSVATVAVKPPFRPTTPNIDAPISFA